MNGGNQRLKYVYVMRFFEEKTDENHKACMNDIIEYLKLYDMEPERRSINQAIEDLFVAGVDIICEEDGKNKLYYLGSRDFEQAELKLLADAVSSSKFITAKKSKILVGKLGKLTSEHLAKELRVQNVIADRVKASNENIYYLVDSINEAIWKNRQIEFLYYAWSADKKLVLKSKEPYVVSPWSLVWDDENYYLVAYDSTAEHIKHFRVDKMKDLNILEEKRLGRIDYEKLDTGAFGKKMFGMFDGDRKRVVLRFKNHLAGVVIDRFGTDVAMRRVDDEHFEVSTEVFVSGQFFGWIFGLGADVKLIAPDDVVTQFREYAKAIMKEYY